MRTLVTHARRHGGYAVEATPRTAVRRLHGAGRAVRRLGQRRHEQRQHLPGRRGTAPAAASAAASAGPGARGRRRHRLVRRERPGRGHRGADRRASRRHRVHARRQRLPERLRRRTTRATTRAGAASSRAPSRPSGGHDYTTTGASGYFDYFGAAAGDPSKGYYSYDLRRLARRRAQQQLRAGGRLRAGLAQEQWLRRDLAAHPAAARSRTGTTRWSAPATRTATSRECSRSGRPSTTTAPTSWWAATSTCTSASCRRRRPAALDEAHGITQFTVGTGGYMLYGFRRSAAAEQRRADQRRPRRAQARTSTRPATSWEFLPIIGRTSTDSGTAGCHGPANPPPPLPPPPTPPPPPGPPGPYRGTVLSDSPVAYWRLGESSGTTAADELGAAPGTYKQGVTFGAVGALADYANAAVSLDGGDDRVTMGDPVDGRLDFGTAGLHGRGVGARDGQRRTCDPREAGVRNAGAAVLAGRR